MKQIAVIQFPGSNCERETIMAIQRAGMHAVPFLWNDKTPLDQFDGFVIIGGFSYEDRCRSGLIAAKDPLLKAITQQAEQGKPVLGICNGAQILVESGLVPGVKQGDHYQLAAALTINKRVNDAGNVLGTGFYNTWCYVKADQIQPNSVFNRHLAEPMHIPLAHAEGRFVLAKETLAALKAAGATLWYYSNAAGEIDPHFPTNPNGSVENLAAIANPAGNVLAIMPHPERTPNGDGVFTSMREYLEQGKPVQAKPLMVDLSEPVVALYRQLADAHQYLVKMIITDNEAVSVQKALHKLGIHAEVRKYQHWQINTEMDKAQLLSALEESCELYNPSKEYVVEDPQFDQSLAWLVRDNEDVLGKHKLANLHKQCGLTQIHDVHHGIVWQVIPETIAELDSIHALLNQHHVFYNPLAHEVYRYAG